MYGALLFTGAKLNPDIHVRHPEQVNTIMCGADFKTCVPIGVVTHDDPQLHAECLTAWKARKREVQPNDTM
jgi:hypothetical protein